MTKLAKADYALVLLWWLRLEILYNMTNIKEDPFKLALQLEGIAKLKFSGIQSTPSYLTPFYLTPSYLTIFLPFYLYGHKNIKFILF